MFSSVMSEISSIVRILLSDVLYCIIRLAHVSRSVINKSTGYFFEVVFMWKFLTEVANRVWVKMYWPASEDHIACTIVPCVAGNEKPLKRRAFLGTAKAGTDARGSKLLMGCPPQQQGYRVAFSREELNQQLSWADGTLCRSHNRASRRTHSRDICLDCTERGYIVLQATQRLPSNAPSMNAMERYKCPCYSVPLTSPLSPLPET